MTSLIDQNMVRARDAAQREFDSAKTQLDFVDAQIARCKPTDDIATLKRDFDKAVVTFEDAKLELERIDGNIASARKHEAAHEANPGVGRLSAGYVRSLSEPAVYAAHNSFEQSFFADAYAFQYSADPMARERLERHGNMNADELRSRGIQTRDVGTGAFAGLTVPQYLVDMYAQYARAGSALLNLIAQKAILPEKGLTINLSRITTGSAVAAQASENTGVQETDMDDTLLTVNINTYAGQQDVSRQAMERSELVDVAIYQDLASAYLTKVDADLISGPGTGGRHLGITAVSGINAVTYTDASPTVPELYPKVADAIRQVNASFVAKATAIVMHSRRWAWITASLDSSNRPLFVPNVAGPHNAFAVGEAGSYGQVVGQFLSLPVITDDNITVTNGAGTNEDQILVVSAANLRFWGESADLMPRLLKFEQTTAPQSIRLAAWGYSAWTAGRFPTANSVISGSGNSTPTF